MIEVPLFLCRKYIGGGFWALRRCWEPKMSLRSTWDVIFETAVSNFPKKHYFWVEKNYFWDGPSQYPLSNVGLNEIDHLVHYLIYYFTIYRKVTVCQRVWTSRLGLFFLFLPKKKQTRCSWELRVTKFRTLRSNNGVFYCLRRGFDEDSIFSHHALSPSSNMLLKSRTSM